MLSFDSDARLAAIREKVEAGRRLSFDDGLFLYESADLFALGELANVVRERKNGNFTYYNVNTHLNPTNVCVYRCTFCAFRADLKSDKGYVMTDEQILERADFPSFQKLGNSGGVDLAGPGPPLFLTAGVAQS